MAARAGRLGLLAGAIVMALLPPVMTGPAGATAPTAAPVSSPAGDRDRVARKQAAGCARPAPALRAGVPQTRRDDGSALGAGPLWRPGSLLVRFRPGVDRAQRRCLTRRVLAQPVARMPVFANTWLYRAAPGVSVEAALEFLADRRPVVWAVPNELVAPNGTSATPNDPLMGPASTKDFSDLSLAEQSQFQWYLRAMPTDYENRNGREVPVAFAGIGAREAWRRGHFNAGEVGIIDSGLDGGFATDKDPAASDFNDRPRSRWWWRDRSNFGGTAYRALPGNGAVSFEKITTWPGPWEKCSENDPLDCRPDRTDHGTAVASVLGGYGNNGRGGTGVMQRAEIVPFALHSRYTDTAAVVAAADQAGRLGLPVVNMSLASGFAATGDRLREGKRMWSELFGKYPDTLWVAGAGNSGANLDEAGSEPLYTSFYSAGGPGELPAGRYRRDLWLKTLWPAVLEPGHVSMSSTLPCGVDSIVHDGRPLREVGPWANQARGNLVCVAANRINGQLSTSTNYGPNHVEVSAPGVDIWVAGAAGDRGKFRKARGTSYAAPMVSAVAGMIRTSYERFTAVQVKCLLLEAARRVPLPEQETADAMSPAFLQSRDKPLKDEFYNIPLTMDYEIKRGTPRIDDGRLLRVMGIPHAGVALTLADNLALDQAAADEEIDTKGKRFSKCS